MALQGLGSNERFTMAFATVPAEILSGRDIAQPIPIRDPYGRVVGAIELEPTPIPVYLTLITAMFMHGGFAAPLRQHALSLDLRGQPRGRDGARALSRLLPPDRMLAGLSHVLVTADARGQSADPVPRRLGRDLGRARRLHRALPAAARPHDLLYQMLQVPAIFAIGIWFLFQLISGAGMLGGNMGGVAYGAHIGGFLAGVVLVKLFARPRGSLAAALRRAATPGTSPEPAGS